MRSILIKSLVGALSLLRVTNARPNLQSRSQISDWCTLGYTYDDIWHPDPEFGDLNLHATTSDSEFCCDLCYRSNYDCVVAIWDPKTFDCKMYINDKKTGEPPRYEWEIDTCPSGISIKGVISTKVYDLTRNWIGPCWEPSDWSNGINIVTNLTLPDDFYPP